MSFVRRLCLSVAPFVVLTPSFSVADVITQTVPFDYNADKGVTFPVMQGFDSLGGGRQLTGVTFEFHHNFELDLYIESTGPTPVAAADFNLSISYITLFQIGQGEHPPFFGPGALFVENASGDLAAYDGIPGNDGPDSYRRTLTDAFVIAQAYGAAEPDLLAAVTDVGEITTVFGGFLELFVEWNNDPSWPPPANGFPEYPGDASIWPSAPSLRHFGEIEITYEYVNVPGPASAALLALTALVPFARRRR
jgi:hypothetical protein